MSETGKGSQNATSAVHPDNDTDEMDQRKRPRSNSGSDNTCQRETPVLRSDLETPLSSASLPVVGYHLVLVGPLHLTRPLSNTLMKEVNTRRTMSKDIFLKRSNPQLESDLLLLTALEREIPTRYRTKNSSLLSDHYRNNSATIRNALPSARPHRQHFVHLLDKLSGEDARNNSVPYPHHTVLVLELSPRSFCRGSLHELVVVQRAVQDYNCHCHGILPVYRHSTPTLLILLNSQADNAERSVSTNNATKTFLQQTTILTCRGGEDDRTAGMVWQRCYHSLRQSSPNHYTTLSPLVL